MSKKFKNKYRVDTIRLRNWDYGGEAMYFVTICTKTREHYFGNCRDGEMVLNDIGKFVQSEWVKTFEMRPDMNLFMGEYVVMPDHFHAIVGIGDNQYNTNRGNPGGDAMHCVSTRVAGNQFGPQSKNLASVIRGFKIGVTVRARTINHNFGWQSLYYESIILDETSFHRISKYIINNPSKWKKDTLQ